MKSNMSKSINQSINQRFGCFFLAFSEPDKHNLGKGIIQPWPFTVTNICECSNFHQLLALSTCSICTDKRKPTFNTVPFVLCSFCRKFFKAEAPQFGSSNSSKPILDNVSKAFDMFCICNSGNAKEIKRKKECNDIFRFVPKTNAISTYMQTRNDKKKKEKSTIISPRKKNTTISSDLYQKLMQY